MGAKKLHEFINHNCLYCQRYEACERLVDLREAVEQGEDPDQNGRCAEFRDVNAPVLGREAPDKGRLDV